MGMAASQARFLSLTARKTNIEYEGQQINEQRTVLANKSASLYNQMLTLSVPTPPNSQDFTKIQYTFELPNNSAVATVSQITKDALGTYTISFSYTETELGFPACTTKQRSEVTSKTTGSPDTYTIETYKGKAYTLEYYNDGSPPDKDPHKDAYEALCKSSGDKLYYINVGTESAPSYQYYKKSELDAAFISTEDKHCVYYTAGEVEIYKEDTYNGCYIERDKNNRVVSFSYKGEDFAVTTNQIVDDEAYEDAMNEYTYQTYLYEQEMSNINANTSIIQAQDKGLELRLKQLDTEENAIKTEMDAVSSVIKDDIDKSFKTFA